jgi:hypothetical protein
MALMDLDFEFSLERQFHCLRHFSFHDEDQLKFLQEHFPSYPLKDIREQLDMVGSKFDPSFVRQPLDILKSIKKDSFTSRDIENSKIVIQFSFSYKDFPNGIGNSALIPLHELSAHQQASKYKVNRSGYEVWTCEVEELSTTNLLSIIALNQENTLQIVTLFPGDYALAFPLGLGAEEEKKRVFWEGHCLLNRKSIKTK